MNNTGRCAACKYLRRKCPSNCIFSPYFPPNNPQQFACVHRVYGASNVGKMLELLPIQLREEAANSLYFEAQCRIQNPVYGCVGLISQLHRQIYVAECELAKTRAEITMLKSNYPRVEEIEAESNLKSFFIEHGSVALPNLSSFGFI